MSYATNASLEGIAEGLAALKAVYQPSMHLQDYLRTWDLDDKSILAVYHTAVVLEMMHKLNLSPKVFESGVAVSNFRDKSSRTRSAFLSAASLLGLTVQDFDESKSQVAHGETTRETATMLSFLTEAIGIRDDLFIHHGHKYEKEVADAVEESFRAGVLPQRPVVVNLQCDEDHPTQSMADLMHLTVHFGGSLEGLKGRKIAVSWAYSPSYGKPLSVPQGLITLLTRFGMDVTLAHPPGFDLMPHTLEAARQHAASSGGQFRVVDSMEEAARGAAVVYAKSWAPVHIMERRCDLLQRGAAGEQAMKELERECIEFNSKFMQWECTSDVMKTTAGVHGGEGLYMHCLPADITGDNCTHGEVASDVFARHRLATYAEARHKPFVIAAAIMLARIQDTPAVLEGLVAQARPIRR